MMKFLSFNPAANDNISKQLSFNPMAKNAVQEEQKQEVS
jgi:hypothetical protein